jgi:zinc protease
MTDRPGRARVRHRDGHRHVLKRVLCLAAALAASSSVVASAQDLERPLDLDRSVHRRVLPNGVTYFVQRIRTNATAENPTPRRRLVLRLTVRAESIDEAPDERGFAHMLEHMAFNGSTRFAPGQILSHFQSVGARLGPHVNAVTSYDSTTYLLDIHTDRVAQFGGAIRRAVDSASASRGSVKARARTSRCADACEGRAAPTSSAACICVTRSTDTCRSTVIRS